VVGTVPCRVSTEVHAGGQRIIGASTMTAIVDSEYNSKRARLVSTEGCEIVGPGYPKLMHTVGWRAVGDGNPLHEDRMSVVPRTWGNKDKAADSGAMTER
jgi:hypothetical protein